MGGFSAKCVVIRGYLLTPTQTNVMDSCVQEAIGQPEYRDWHFDSLDLIYDYRESTIGNGSDAARFPGVVSVLKRVSVSKVGKDNGLRLQFAGNPTNVFPYLPGDGADACSAKYTCLKCGNEKEIALDFGNDVSNGKYSVCVGATYVNELQFTNHACAILDNLVGAERGSILVLFPAGVQPANLELESRTNEGEWIKVCHVIRLGEKKLEFQPFVLRVWA
jgi:hypothetical protein